MPEAKQRVAARWQVALPLRYLFEDLHREGFAEAYAPRMHLRLAALLEHLEVEMASLERIKYRLAALLSHSAEEQEKFYRIFDAFVEKHGLEEDTQATPGQTTAEELSTRKTSSEPIKEDQETSKSAANASLRERPSTAPPPLATAARNGPITFELRFREDGFRPWNLPELEPALRQLREKEWVEVEGLDLPASIKKTMQMGGMPQVVRQKQRRAPQYLFLIEQKSLRDHLALLYVDLVKELRRRDMDVEYYFYEYNPYRCWKDRRRPASYTTLDRLLPNTPTAAFSL